MASSALELNNTSELERSGSLVVSESKCSWCLKCWQDLLHPTSQIFLSQNLSLMRYQFSTYGEKKAVNNTHDLRLG